MRFNPMKDVKQKDIEWFHDLFKPKVDMVVKHAIDARKDKLTSGEQELTDQLSSGKSYFGFEAEKLGLIDAAVTPDEYFTGTLFKGEKYKLGTHSPSFWQKLSGGSANGIGLSGMIAESLFDDIELDDFEMGNEMSMYNDMAEAAMNPDMASKPLFISRHAEDIFK